MNQDKVIERIVSLLKRTEENGASPAEAETAARMVCKLLVQFPGILNAQAPLKMPNRTKTPRYDNDLSTGGSENVPIRYQNIVHQTDVSIALMINNREVWLPLNKITLKRSVVWMPKWLAKVNKLL